ncbi:Uncharacterised protein [Vibrio cholerae]|nr:Uncharacterised protein [Vibrio cholerae]CSI87560.1 Uncharacterised protein [Vibrio cholerae]
MPLAPSKSFFRCYLSSDPTGNALSRDQSYRNKSLHLVAQPRWRSWDHPLAA